MCNERMRAMVLAWDRNFVWNLLHKSTPEVEEFLDERLHSFGYTNTADKIFDQKFYEHRVRTIDRAIDLFKKHETPIEFMTFTSIWNKAESGIT